MGASRTPGRGSEATVSPTGSERRVGFEPGHEVGRYLVQRRIGSGGMGVVLAARDPQLDRTVAIKVLFREDARGETWLRREAQALARLNHPSIVGILDVGVVLGRPFIAMEHIDGITLRGWLDDRARSTSEILVVFRAAGRALAAAHASGLIHCDFKPSNVMVRSGSGSKISLADGVCVMDFGLAQLAAEPSSLDESASPLVVVDSSHSVLSQEFTGIDKAQGTPKYMAPEQFANLGVSPATDQYAFCIALYEALWSCSPFRGDNPSARMAEQMCGQPPHPPPATWRQRRVAEAVMRGLAPAPAERWPSMEALLDGLSPPSKRTWWVAGAGGVAGVAALGLLAAADSDETCGHPQDKVDAVWSDSKRAAIDRAFGELDEAYALTAWKRGRSEVDAWSTRWVQASAENCEATFDRRERSEREYDASMHCLSRQLRRLDAVTDLLAEVDTDGVFGALDSILALPKPRNCLEDARPLRPSDPEQAAQVELVYEDLDFCEVVGTTGDVPRFSSCAKAVLESAQEQGDENLLLDARWLQTRAISAAGRREEAVSLGKSLYFDAKASGRAGLAKRAALAVAGTLARFGEEPDEAGEWLRHAQGKGSGLGVQARVARIEALVAHLSRRDEVAIERARVAVELADAAADPAALALCLTTLGSLLNTIGRPGEGRRPLERALAISTKIHGPTHPRVATALNNLATILGRTGDLEGALEMLERSLAIRRAMLPDGDRYIGTATANIAETLQRLGRYEDALPFNVEAAEVFAAVHGRRSAFFGLLSTQLGSNFRALGRYDEARASVDAAVSIFRDKPLDDPDRFEAEVELALLQAETGERGAAMAFFETALQAPLRDDQRDLARTHLEEIRAGE